MTRAERQELKEAVQDELLHWMGNIQYAIGDGHFRPGTFTQEEVRAEVDRQTRRVRKLFGYDG